MSNVGYMSDYVFQQRASTGVKNSWEDVSEILTRLEKGEKFSRKKWLECQGKIGRLGLGRCDALDEYIKTYTKETTQKYYEKIVDVNSSQDLFAYVSTWKSFKAFSDRAQNLLAPLNRQLAPKQDFAGCNPHNFHGDVLTETKSFLDEMLQNWSLVITSLQDFLSEEIFKNMEAERSGKFSVNNDVITAFYQSIKVADPYKGCDEDELRFYKEAIEKPILRKLEGYYATESKKYFGTLSDDDAIARCSEIINQEKEIIKKYLPESVDLIIQRIWSIYVSDNIKRITERAKYYINHGEIENLKVAYTCLKFSCDEMKTVNNEIKERLTKIFINLRETTESTDFTDCFLKTYAKEYNELVYVFGSGSASLGGLHKGISIAVNKGVNDGADKTTKSSNISVAEILVNDFDKFMTKGTRGLPEKDIEKKIDGIVAIFNYIEDKDVFIQLYSKRLAKRLINSSSQSKEGEEMMVSKMKINCGKQFVTKVEKMLTDTELSKELTSKFVNNLRMSFSILVSQTGSWPIESCKSTPLIPQVLSHGMSSFNNFYSKTHSGRKLHWQHEWSTCEIKLNYLSKSCIVQTTVIITSILNLFNNVEAATFEEIRASTDINAKDLQKYLQFLSTQNILSKVTEKFSLNYQFENKKPKIRLVPVFREASQETKDVTKSVMEERKFYLQALVVRIMKSKKSMTHKDLANEVTRESITSFVPSQVFIKSVIDELIHKEYLARAEGDSYNYLA